MVSNTIRLSLGSLLILSMLACRSKPDNVTHIAPKKTIDTCRYYRYDARHIVSNLGCYNCHVRTDERLFKIITFSELSTIDSLKIIDYAFTKKHKGWYSKTGTFKKSRMDTLSDCEIKSAIRYIKDYNRNIPMPNQ
ncbi:hypothetical protein [Pedobacter alluvionis]|uniref:Cytochrome c domain-containing protein n=1 Tax=Pedobacter alluvionis TaxID=475253 RepID=A0A497Y8A4_9SPHI|nr:hypothetical protein [Pedobacter alluvionis]RLJ77198.1 hypothetical protein BCL90_2274 [Pedobacter alluvionis]TFB33571.1 hypothetical protein E3V97_05865 [Pedobacter alluvionis]